jgi:hypothetical protein
MSKKNYTDATFDHEGNFDLAATIEDRRHFGPDRVEYQAPAEDQKWRARNFIAFHFRWFTYKCPPAYRDVLLCVIDHANPKNGRCNVRQKIIALECNLRRETVNRALNWWAENTYFLDIEHRGPTRANAYHVLWDHLEAEWHAIQEMIEANKDSADNSSVTKYITGDVTTYVTPDVITDITPRTIKKNHKEEPHPEWAPSPSEMDAYDPFMKEEKGLQGKQVSNSSVPNSLTAEPLSQKAARIGISNEEWGKLRGAK